MTSKETEISISDVPISPGKKNRSKNREKTTLDPFLPSNKTTMPLFVLSTSPAKRSQTNMSQEPPKTSPLNTDETLKSHCFWQNQNYLESNITARK